MPNDPGGGSGGSGSGPGGESSTESEPIVDAGTETDDSEGTTTLEEPEEPEEES